MKRLLVALAMVLAVGVGHAQAAPIVMTFDFVGGFNLSFDGGPQAPSGQVIFTLEVESTTPDLDPDADRGRFALTSISVTAASLGIFNDAVIAPTPLFVDTFSGGLTIIGAGFNPDIGWNGGPAPSTFMGDINDLTTLPLPTSVAMVSTFFLQTITLNSGHTLGGTTGGGGPTGIFTAEAATAIPEPASLLLLGAGLAAAGRRLRRRA
jgi:hypothetical protein